MKCDKLTSTKTKFSENDVIHSVMTITRLALDRVS